MLVLPCRYVFNIKSSILKVRFVAIAFRQVQGVDIYVTFAPVKSLGEMRSILSIISHHDIEMCQVDLVTEFLNG